MPVQYRDLRVNDRGRPLTVENAFRFFASFSGIHDFWFDRAYSLLPTDWLNPDGISLTFAPDEVELDTGSLSAAWHAIRVNDDQIGAEYVAYATVETDASQVGFHVGNVKKEHLRVTLTASGVVEVYQMNGATEGDRLMRVSRPPVGDLGGRFAISHRPFLTGSDKDEDLWLALSLWRDDCLIATYVEKRNATPEGPFGIGLAAYGGDTVTFRDVYVPELSSYAEYGTIDPGEEAAGGLDRTIEGRYLRFFIRHDGSLKAFRNKVTNAVVQLDRDHIYMPAPRVDFRKLKTHVRIMGAHDWAEAIDRSNIRTLGHRFQELNNPMLMSEIDCAREAQRQLRRYRSEAHTSNMETPALPLVELQDRIDEPAGQWILDGYTRAYTPGGILQSSTLRRYTEEDAL